MIILKVPFNYDIQNFIKKNNFSRILQLFSLERVNKSGARFDPDKTKWYNQHYLQGKNNQDLVPAFTAILQEKGILNTTTIQIEKVIGLIKERATFVSDFWDLSDYFFVAPTSFAEKVVPRFATYKDHRMAMAFAPLALF